MTNQDTTPVAAPTSPPIELALVGPLEGLERMDSAAGAEALEQLALARELRAELRAVEAESSAAALGPYFAHNLAALLVGLVDAGATGTAFEPLALAADPVLAAAGIRDPDDLLVVLARLEAATMRAPWAGDLELLELGKRATGRPHAGDRLMAAHARVVAHVASAADKKLRAGAMRYADDALAEIGAYLARHPLHEGVSRVRIELLSLRVRRATGKARDEAFLLARTALAEYGSRFGQTARTAALELGVLVDRLVGDDSAPPAAIRDARSRLQRVAAERAVAVSDALTAFRTLDRGKHLDEEAYAELAEVFGDWAEEARPDDADALRRARHRALTATGDDDALLSDAIETLQRDPKNRNAAGRIGQTIVDALHTKAAPPAVSPELLAAAVRELPHARSARWNLKTVLAWLDYVATQLGDEIAAEHAASNLLQVKALRAHEALYRQAMELLRRAGHADRALAVAEKGIELGGHDSLRIDVAEAWLADGKLAAAEQLLRPALKADGDTGVRARQLRDKIQSSPAFADAQRAELLDFEKEVGIGSGQQIRLRVRFLGDGFALGDVIERKAPAVYGQPHLRVMIRRNELPGYLDVADLRKGQDLFAPVRGEDDKKAGKKGSLRVYWIADGALADPGWSNEQKEERAAQLDRHYGLGGGAVIPLRVDRVSPRAQALWARPVQPKGAPPFPTELRVPAGDLGGGVPLNAIKPGTLLHAPVDSEPWKERGPGERRYRVRGPVQVDLGGAE